MKIGVDTGQLGNTYTELMKDLEQIKKCRVTMFKEIETLNGMWEGDAHSAFLAACTADDQEMQAFITMLEGLFGDVASARISYETTENENQRIAASIQI